MVGIRMSAGRAWSGIDGDEDQVRLLLSLGGVFGIGKLKGVLVVTFITTSRTREAFQAIAVICEERFNRQVKRSPKVAEGSVQAFKE